MQTSRIILIGIVSAFLSGCASSTMVIKDDVKEGISPIGIYVCSSTQIYDNKDIVHRDFVIKNSFLDFEKLLGEKYRILNLNNLIPHEKVFKKNFGSFYINDKEIGRYAKDNNCSTFLIVYYAETEANFNFVLPAPALNRAFWVSFIGYPTKGENGFVMHSNCSLYGWLFNTGTRKIIKRSHSVLESFNSYIDKKNLGDADVESYASFLSQITNKMFTGLK